MHCFISRNLVFLAWMGLLFATGRLFGQPNAYLPEPGCQPLKVNVNLIILQRADGSGNFQDNAEDRAFLYNMILVTNQVFANLVDRNEEYHPGRNLPYLSSAKIELVSRALFIRDEWGWNNRNDRNFAGIPHLSGWYLDSLDREIYRDETSPKAINLYFTTDGQLYEEMVLHRATTDYDQRVFFKQHAASEIPAASGTSSTDGQFHSMRCHIANVWLKRWWKRHVLHEPDWAMEYEAGKSIAHELGHLMGLAHTSDAHLHALMRTRFGGLRDYLTAQEIAKIHQIFAVYPSLWQYVPGDVRYGCPSADRVVTGEERWGEVRRFYASILVKTGASLTIGTEVILPDDGTVTVEPGATLRLEAGTVRRMDGSTEGLVVRAGGDD